MLLDDGDPACPFFFAFVFFRNYQDTIVDHKFVIIALVELPIVDDVR